MKKVQLYYDLNLTIRSLLTFFSVTCLEYFAYYHYAYVCHIEEYKFIRDLTELFYALLIFFETLRKLSLETGLYVIWIEFYCFLCILA